MNASDASRHGGQRILPRQSVAMRNVPVRVGHSPTHAETVEIELLRDGDVVREIHVKCPCGQTLVLECNYATDVQTT